MRSRLFLIFLTIYLPFPASSQLISKVVAKVDKTYLTSRDVLMTSLISECMAGRCDPEATAIDTDLRSDLFSNHLSKSIFERMAYMESLATFKERPSPPSQLIRNILRHPISRKYKFEKRELEILYRIKVLSKKYVNFKDRNLSVFVSEKEIRSFYNDNLDLFKDKEFDQVKKYIRSEIKLAKKGKRVENWINRMQLKYRTKVYIE